MRLVSGLLVGCLFAVTAPSQETTLDEEIRRLMERADEGDAESQVNLARRYLEGRSVPRNEAQAAEWFQKAAEQGYFPAEVLLGCLYEKGRGVPKDVATAYQWYRRAGEHGSVTAQINLAGAYFFGRDVPRDPEEGVGWYLRAAEQGITYAQLMLGWIYSGGRHGIQQDYVKAYFWLSLAAERFGGTGRTDRIAKKMTPEQIAEAQRLLDEWKSRNPE